MSETIQFIDGNTMTLLGEVPAASAPESVRTFDGVPIVKVMRFTFDRTGQLTPADSAYNGFLKFFDAAGKQVKETFIAYEPGASLTHSNLFPA